ncbi:hypothetical protein HN937_01510 [Candidatus Poribacteria bacterium]|nr:hypothetical protein [Candidatus Poribacteria bacterium]
MHFATVTAACCAILLSVSCGGATVGQLRTIDGAQFYYDANDTWIPAWIMGHLPYSEDGGFRDTLQAVGASGKRANPVGARSTAINAGRTEIARVLGVTVQNLLKIWEQEHTDYFDGSGDSSIVYSEEVGRTITQADMTGSTAVAQYEHPVTGVHFTLMELARSDAIEEALSRARAAARARKTAFVEGKVDEAMDELDEVIKGLQPEDFYSNTRVAD